jgi:hypothetical protein
MPHQSPEGMICNPNFGLTTFCGVLVEPNTMKHILCRSDLNIQCEQRGIAIVLCISSPVNFRTAGEYIVKVIVRKQLLDIALLHLVPDLLFVPCLNN